MKCGLTLIKRKYKKSTKQIYALRQDHLDGYAKLGKNLVGKDDFVEKCDGDIYLYLDLKNESVMGGTEALLDIAWICRKCGNQHGHPQLPNTVDKLAEFVSKMITYAPDAADKIEQEETEKHDKLKELYNKIVGD